jgi:hypothetical protein
MEVILLNCVKPIYMGLSGCSIQCLQFARKVVEITDKPRNIMWEVMADWLTHLLCGSSPVTVSLYYSSSLTMPINLPHAYLCKGFELVRRRAFLTYKCDENLVTKSFQLGSPSKQINCSLNPVFDTWHAFDVWSVSIFNCQIWFSVSELELIWFEACQEDSTFEAWARANCPSVRGVLLWVYSVIYEDDW